MVAATYALIGVLTLAGLPLFAAFTAVAIVGLMALGFDPIIAPLEFFRLASMPVLTAIPLFTLAGVLVSFGRTPRRLLAVGREALGWLPGGLAIAALVVCAVFTAFTGASGVTIVALGGLLLPGLLQEGFTRRFSLGLVTTAGGAGLLFPPSLPVILLAVTAGLAVDRLFLASLVPGILILGLLALYAVVSGRRAAGASHRRRRFSLSRLWRAVVLARWELPLPFGIVAGIYGGLFTVPEAATVAAAYAAILTILIRREVGLQAISEVAQRTAVLVGAIMIVLAGATALTTLLVDQQVPQRLLEWIRPVLKTKTQFLLAANGLLLIAGMMMDIFSATVVLVPILLPLALEFDVDPVHFAVVFLANLEIGYLTPPVGINLFIARIRFKTSLTTLYWSVLPFLGLLLAALALITFLPGLALGAREE